MKTFLTLAFMLITGIVPAQTTNKENLKTEVATEQTQPAEDSLFQIALEEYGFYKIPTDTTGMGQYGLRIYDPRISRYIAVDTSNTKCNPYAYARKEPEALK